MEQTYLTGTLAGAGSFRCRECGYGVALDSLKQVPECPNCGATAFTRASLFEPNGPVGDPVLQEEADDDHEWAAAVRSGLQEPGHYLVCRDDDRISVMPLTSEWTRIGRSLAADVRLDDPTVSRRHALIVREGGGARVLDDRSLNGVFLNGEAVEWADLNDGDELVIGRYRLRFFDTAGATASAEAGASKTLA